MPLLGLYKTVSPVSETATRLDANGVLATAKDSVINVKGELPCNI